MGYTPPYLEVRKIAGGYNLFPPSATTTDDLTIFPNLTDTAAYLKLNGNGNINAGIPSGGYFIITEVGTGNLCLVQHVASDVVISTELANNNISLVPNGTGKVKFGTYSAGAATDSTGYISIIDAGGTARKLMVQA